jgi:hypothetical protein
VSYSSAVATAPCADEGAEADDAVAELQCMLAQELLADPADDR